MKIRIINKSIVADGSDIDLKIIKAFDNDDDMFPYIDIYCADDLSDNDTDSVLIAKILNKYYDCNFEIEYSAEEIECPICGICDNINILIYKDYNMVIKNYVDKHLGFNVGTTENEVINDWNKLGIKVEYLTEGESYEMSVLFQ